jgi:hypothetical protein
VLTGLTVQVVVFSNKEQQAAVRAVAALSSRLFAILVFLRSMGSVVCTCYQYEVVQTMTGLADVECMESWRLCIVMVVLSLPEASTMALIMGLGLLVGILAMSEVGVGMFGHLSP